MSVVFEAGGAWTALVTPFGDDGRIDPDRFRRLVDFQIGQGITGVVPCGTTGESPTLGADEHDALIRLAVEAAGGRIGVLAGTGSNDTARAIHATRHAREAGASAALVVDCYYNGPSSLELRTEYYERILAAVPALPIVPYIIPGRAGCALEAGDLAALHLADPRRVPAVKQATGDLERMRRDRELAGPGLAILSGDDEMTLSMMDDGVIGAAGVISVMSNLVPGAIAAMVAAHRRGDRGQASGLGARLAPLFKLVGVKVKSTRRLPDGRTAEVEDKFRNPVPLKTMMIGLGMIGGAARPPLGRMTRPAVELCRDALRTVHREAPELLRPIEQAFGVDVAARLADDVVWP